MDTIGEFSFLRRAMMSLLNGGIFLIERPWCGEMIDSLNGEKSMKHNDHFLPYGHSFDFSFSS